MIGERKQLWVIGSEPLRSPPGTVTAPRSNAVPWFWHESGQWVKFEEDATHYQTTKAASRILEEIRKELPLLKFGLRSIEATK